MRFPPASPARRTGQHRSLTVDAMGSNVGIASTGELTAADVAAVRELVDAAAAEDGYFALNEAGLLPLQDPRPPGRPLLARWRGRRGVPGLGRVEAGTATSTGLLVVAPGARR